MRNYKNLYKNIVEHNRGPNNRFEQWSDLFYFTSAKTHVSACTREIDLVSVFGIRRDFYITGVPNTNQI